MFELPNNTVFYKIERVIKEYRQFAQKQISKTFNDITIDQALIFVLISDNPNMSQEELGKITFKEKASVTRMIELLRKNNYLERDIHETDRRRFRLTPTKKGKIALDKIIKIINRNRQVALNNIKPDEILLLGTTLNKLIDNCTQN